MYLNSQNNTVILYFVYIIIVFLCLFHFFPPHCSLYPKWLFPCGVISFTRSALPGPKGQPGDQNLPHPVPLLGLTACTLG